MFRISPICFLLAAALPQLACIDRGVAIAPIESVSEESVSFSVVENRDVDILFVVDNSTSMLREQTSLTAKFSNLIDVLSRDGGLPSIHIGVVSTDLGVGPNNPLCSPTGDRGLFLGSGCTGLDGPFLKSISNEDGSRTENFSGELADTFACMASIGIDGCGFEQPLESMRQALSAPQADDFLRDHAYLAVIFVTDEDDCSVKNQAMFDPSTQTLSSTLGPPKSFRCFDFGVECDGDDLRSLGTKENCVPKIDSPFLYGIDEYINFLYTKKQFPEQIITAIIAGNLDPVTVVSRHDERSNYDYVAVDFSCTETDAEAVPPIRLSAFLDGFGTSSTRTSICESDLSGSLEQIADLIVEKASGCFVNALIDTDPNTEGLQPDCSIAENSPGQAERRIPQCDNLVSPEDSSNLPCFTLDKEERCNSFPTGLAPNVHYPAGFTVPPGTLATARCASE